MDYYFCSADELRQEISRRGRFPVGGQDELSEELKQDDENRGTDATTLKTVDSAQFGPKAKLRIACSDNVVHPNLLVGERITHWSLDTFFPTLQLYFESGLSCTFEGGFRQSAKVGLDQHLRFRLTDLTHEEGGVVANSTLPQKLKGPPKSIKIMEAIIAERTSIAVQSIAPTISNGRPSSRPSSRPSADLKTENHIVVGLRLEGMQKMGYVWAKVDASAPSSANMWHDVSVVRLRDDVPVPFVGFPLKNSRLGSQVDIVTKCSMINSRKRKRNEMEALSGVNGSVLNAHMLNGANGPNGNVDHDQWPETKRKRNGETPWGF